MSTESQFQLFGPVHLATLGLILFTALCFIWIARKKEGKTPDKYCGWALAGVMLLNETVFVAIVIFQGIWSMQWGLPLQLCDLAIFAVAYSLIRHNQVIWELAYFWGLGGTLQALLTPDLSVTFPDLIYFKFFMTHGCIVIGVLFLAAGRKRPIYRFSLKRVWVITHVYAIVISVFNLAFKTNYGYLCHKPIHSSVLDYFGPWPQYLIGLEVILVGSLLLYYFPYHIVNKRVV